MDGLANKKDPPKPNEKEEPGFGPEVKQDSEKKEKEEESRSEERGSKIEDRACAGCCDPRPSILDSRSSLPFAVIPTVFIMGPLALLAALFPAVFGGLAMFMKRWMALMMVACTNSTLFTIHMLMGASARGAWWGSQTTLWATMTLVTLASAIWSRIAIARFR